MENGRRIIAGIAVLLLFAAFLWTSHQILTPVVTGAILLFFLSGIKEYPLARRLSGSVVIILLLWIFVNAQAVIFPFIAAFVLAYLFDPLVDILCKWKIPRTLVVVCILVIAFGVLILLGLILIPTLVQEIQDFIGNIPTLAGKVSVFVQNNLPRVLRFLNVDAEKLQQNLVNKIPSTVEQILSNLLKGISGIGTFLSQLFNIILIPILTFYFLKDFDKIRSWFMGFVPTKFRNNTYFYMWRMNRILGGYIRGQIIVCTIVGVCTGLGLAILGIPYALLLAVMTGLLNIIPYIGLYVSLGLSLLTALFTPQVLLSMIKIGGVFAVVQGMEAYAVSPKIVGDRVGLHPLAVIFSILIFSKFIGFWGLIIGVPSAALIKFLIDEWKRHQKWKEVRDKKILPEN